MNLVEHARLGVRNRLKGLKLWRPLLHAQGVANLKMEKEAFEA